MSSDVEMLVRIVAAVAAVALVASPLVVAAWQRFQSWLTQRPAATDDATLRDMMLVLQIANRLRLAGNEDGVDLCEKLLTCMLATSPEADA